MASDVSGYLFGYATSNFNVIQMFDQKRMEEQFSIEEDEKEEDMLENPFTDQSYGHDDEANEPYENREIVYEEFDTGISVSSYMIELSDYDTEYVDSLPDFCIIEDDMTFSPENYSPDITSTSDRTEIEEQGDSENQIKSTNFMNNELLEPDPDEYLFAQLFGVEEDELEEDTDDTIFSNLIGLATEPEETDEPLLELNDKRDLNITHTENHIDTRDVLAEISVIDDLLDGITFYNEEPEIINSNSENDPLEREEINQTHQGSSLRLNKTQYFNKAPDNELQSNFQTLEEQIEKSDFLDLDEETEVDLLSRKIGVVKDESDEDRWKLEILRLKKEIYTIEPTNIGCEENINQNINLTDNHIESKDALTELSMIDDLLDGITFYKEDPELTNQNLDNKPLSADAFNAQELQEPSIGPSKTGYLKNEIKMENLVPDLEPVLSDELDIIHNPGDLDDKTLIIEGHVKSEKIERNSEIKISNRTYSDGYMQNTAEAKTEETSEDDTEQLEEEIEDEEDGEKSDNKERNITKQHRKLISEVIHAMSQQTIQVLMDKNLEEEKSSQRKSYTGRPDAGYSLFSSDVTNASYVRPTKPMPSIFSSPDPSQPMYSFFKNTYPKPIFGSSFNKNTSNGSSKSANVSKATSKHSKESDDLIEEVGSVSEVSRFNSNDFQIVFEKFIKSSGYPTGYSDDALVIGGKLFLINTSEDLQLIKSRDPERYSLLVQFTQLQSLTHIDPSLDETLLKNEIGSILTMNSGFVYGSYGSCGWLGDNSGYLGNFTSSLLDKLIDKIFNHIGKIVNPNIVKFNAASISNAANWFKVAPEDAVVFCNMLTKNVYDPNFINKLKTYFDDIIYDISKIKNFRMSRAIAEVISTLLGSSEADVLKQSVTKSDVSKFIIRNSDEIDMYKLDVLLEMLDNFIDRSNKIKSDEFDDIIEEAKNLDDGFFDDIYHEIYINYIDQIRKKAKSIFLDGNDQLVDRVIVKQFDKNFEEIDKKIAAQIEIMKKEKVGQRELSPIELGKILKGWLGEVDLMGRWMDQWIDINKLRIIEEGGIGLEPFILSLPLNKQKNVTDNKSLEKYFKDLFRDNASISPVVNGFDLTMSIRTVDLGKLATTKKQTTKFISEFKYINVKSLTLRKLGSSSGLSFLNSADLITKFSTLDGRFTDLYKKADADDIDIHVEGYYDMLDQSLTAAKLTRNSEIRPLIARIEKPKNEFRFINLPLDANRFDESFVFGGKREWSINDEISEHMDSAVNVKIYPMDPKNPATLKLSPDGKWEFDNPDPKWEKYRLGNRFNDPSNGEKVIIDDGNRVGFVKVVDDSINIKIFKDTKGNLKAWVDDSEYVETSKVNLQFRGISVTNEYELTELFDKGVIYTHRVYKMDQITGNMILDTIKSDKTFLNEFKDGSTNLYPRTKDSYETDLSGNLIYDNEGSLIGNKYGSKNTRDNIFKSITTVEDDQSEFFGYYFIQSNDGKKIFLSTDKEGLNVAKGRFEGIINGNYELLNPDNHVDKVVTYLGLPESEITHYFKYAYDYDGKIEKKLVIHREGIRIGGGKFDIDVDLFDELMNSFVGLSHLEQAKMKPILISHIERLLDDPTFNPADLDGLLNDLHNLYDEFIGTGDLRGRAISILKRELDDNMRRIKETINSRSFSPNIYMVDNLIAKDFVKNSNIKIEKPTDNYFLVSYKGGNRQKQPFDFLFDYNDNILYLKDGRNPSKVRVIKDLIDPKQVGNSFIDLNIIRDYLDKMGLANNKIDNILANTGGILYNSIGYFYHIHGLHKLVIEFNSKSDADLYSGIKSMLNFRKNKLSGESCIFDGDYNIAIMSDKDIALSVDHITDILFLEHLQYMRSLTTIIDKYNIDIKSLNIKYTDLLGSKIKTATSLNDLVDFSRLSMLRSMMIDTELADGSGFALINYYLQFFKSSQYWIEDNVYKQIGTFDSNTLLRSLYIPNSDDNSLTPLLNGLHRRQLFGPGSYFNLMLGEPSMSGGRYEWLDQDSDLISSLYGSYSHFIQDLENMINNFSLNKEYSGKNLKIKEFGIGHIAVDLKQLFGFKNGKGSGPSRKENSILIFNRIISQLAEKFHPTPGKYLDRTISAYISKAIKDYINRS